MVAVNAMFVRALGNAFCKLSERTAGEPDQIVSARPSDMD